MIYRGMKEAAPFLKKLQERLKLDSSHQAEVARSIIQSVRERGDDALREYAKKFDETDYDLFPLEVEPEEIEEAYTKVSEEQLAAIRLAIHNLTTYHEKQREEGYVLSGEGIRIAQRVLPIHRVGIYVPGGTASYPSSVLMNVVPARIAGVREIYMATPAREGILPPLTLVAAAEAGVHHIFRMGGAQAVAALAYGTRTIPKVDKITGPGNAYVSAAKREVFGVVGIESLAGPSEIVIVADQTGNPSYLAADLLSQAEHDPLSAAILITADQDLAIKTESAIKRQLVRLSRSEIARQSMGAFGGIIVVDHLEQCAEMVNLIAPEHLELCVKEPYSFLDKVENAGGIFIGNGTPEPLGDYLAGTNHVLPTGGTSRFSSPLGVYDFYKRQSVLEYDIKALRKVAGSVVTFAEAEGLTAHGEAIRVRVGGEE